MTKEEIKLVIWDLDETFWGGTLSEGDVLQIQENIDIVRYLVDRGIMNSISSKNDFEKAKSKLVELGVFDLFIFPHINWYPKGEQVADILNCCSLRPENTIFVDDNISNRNEVSYYNKGIRTAESISLSTVKSDDIFKGKDDSSHSRLTQYKILEKRIEDKKSYSNNSTFLRQSKIHVQIMTDCLNVIDRLFELVSRTNQLNYTKNRPSYDEFKESILENDSYYFSARDKYGDYGIVGFYQIDKLTKKVIHFLFSCRILGMTIDSFIWQYFGKPEITIIEPVASHLISNSIKYIHLDKPNVTTKKTKLSKTKNSKILMIGGCDLEQTAHYLSNSKNISLFTEFNRSINGYDIRSSDLCSFINQRKLSEKAKNELCANICFYDKSITFNSSIFAGSYDVIILSVVDDYIRGFYKSHTKDFSIGLFGYQKQDQEYWRSKCDKNTINYLNSNFDFVGGQEPNDFRDKLMKVLGEIPHKTKVYLINGCEIDMSSIIGIEQVKRNIMFNKIVDNVCQMFDNVSLIDMRRIATSRNDLTGIDNRHYVRDIYYKIAKYIHKQIGVDIKKEKKKMKFISKIKMKIDNYIASKSYLLRKHMIADTSYLVKTAIVHQKTFTQFKDFCKGKKLVICGAGPSLNNYKPIPDAVHIALNRAFLFDKVHFDFIYSQDFDGIKMVQEELIKYPNTIKLFGQICLRSKEIPEQLARECGALRFYLNDYLVGGYKNCKFVKDIDLEPISGFPVVGLSVMQFALYMNPSDIYIVGMDTSGGHFKNPHQNQEEVLKEKNELEAYWKQEYEMQVEKWKELIIFRNCFYPNTNIHSINPVGLKGIFDDIYQ